MPPLWKIKRELIRLKQQLLSPISLLLSPLRRMLHDRRSARATVVTELAAPDHEEIAIFLVYAPGGLLGSHLHMIDHLRRNRFSVFVIANHALGEQDKSLLSGRAFRIMERPNLGYDFGGYRDAILHLKRSELEFKSLLICNDSIWYPIGPGDNLLSEMRSWKADLAGFCLDHHKRSRGESFMQSYFFLFGERACSDPDFYEYWRRIVFSGNKHLIIRRLEMGMTPHFRRLGYSVRARHEYAHLGELLARLPDHRLQTFLEFEAERLGTTGDDLLQDLRSGSRPGTDSPTWKELARLSQVEGHILKLPPELLIDVFQSPMLKKLRSGAFAQQRNALKSKGFLDAVDPVIREEILEWD